jgi:hypothetical protein
MAPRVGSIRDETWVFINGAILLLAGLLLLARLVLLLIMG